MTVENLQQGSTISPEQHLKDVNGAIDAATSGNPAAAGPLLGGGNDPMIDALVTSPIQPVSAFVSLLDGYGGSSSKGGGTSPTQQKGGVSMFVDGSSTQPQRRPAPTPLVPMGYGEMKAAAKRGLKMGGTGKDGGIFVAARLASISLTGSDTAEGKDGSPSTGKKTPASGAKMDPTMLAAMGLFALAAELSLTLKKIQGVNRYDNNGNLLQQDLLRGAAPAKATAQQSPHMAHWAMGANMK